MQAANIHCQSFINKTELEKLNLYIFCIQIEGAKVSKFPPI